MVTANEYVDDHLTGSTAFLYSIKDTLSSIETTVSAAMSLVAHVNAHDQDEAERSTCLPILFGQRWPERDPTAPSSQEQSLTMFKNP